MRTSRLAAGKRVVNNHENPRDNVLDNDDDDKKEKEEGVVRGDDSRVPVVV